MWKPTQTSSPRMSGFYPLRAQEAIPSHGSLPMIMGWYSEVQNKWTIQSNSDSYGKWLVESGKYTQWYDWEASTPDEQMVTVQERTSSVPCARCGGRRHVR